MGTESKPKIVIIVACGKNNIIGKDNKLPWKNLRDDMDNYKRTTIGDVDTTGVMNILIAGRKTFLSFGKPLPKRINVVLSRDPQYQPNNGLGKTPVCALTSYDEAMRYAFHKWNHSGQKSIIFVVGGAEVYRQALMDTTYLVDEIIKTEVDGEFEGDTYFPELPPGEWRKESVLATFPKNERNDYPFEIVKYVRVNPAA